MADEKREKISLQEAMIALEVGKQIIKEFKEYCKEKGIPFDEEARQGK